MLTVECCEFLLDVVGVRLEETDRLWFFSDWVSVVPRTFEERLWDLCVSRGVFARSASVGVEPSGAKRSEALDGVSVSAVH